LESHSSNSKKSYLKSKLKLGVELCARVLAYSQSLGFNLQHCKITN
jgi:hypothetical protein